VEATNFLGRGAKFAPTDVVHRPTQLFSWSDLDLIPRLGDRFVVTQLDLIAYRNPTYSRSYAEWNAYRQLTRLTLALADCVVFMSEHPARDAIADELVDERRSRVVHLGVDHHVSVSSVARRPERLPESADANFALCLGTNFRHKNRTFALQLLEALQDRHGWDGWLIFAGPGAASGTSASDEAAFLSTRPGVAGRVADLDAVSDEEKFWLLREARGVVFPSTYEGFGLIPFEAAEQGTPCFHACQTSLGDILPERSATLVPWNAAESADAIVPALQDGEAARALTELVLDAGRKLRWARAAEAMLDVYSGVIHAPNREVARVADVRLPVSLSAFRSAESEGLVDLPPDAYRAVYGLAMNHVTGPAFLALAKALYATGHFLRRGRRPSVEDAV
jgi:glycosyltransferase involved in cell wall biosynthesis